MKLTDKASMAYLEQDLEDLIDMIDEDQKGRSIDFLSAREYAQNIQGEIEHILKVHREE